MVCRFEARCCCNVSPKVSLVAHVGFAGWKSVKQKGSSVDAHTWGASLDGNTLLSEFTTTSNKLN